MGRPVNDRYFGATEGSVGTEGNNFTINAKVGANTVVENGVILRQRTVNKFKVNDDPDGTSGNEGICTLVAKASGALGNNEMSINGIIAATGDSVWVTKLYNRTCRDENNNRYTWSIVDDSSANYMQLVAI